VIGDLSGERVIVSGDRMIAAHQETDHQITTPDQITTSPDHQITR
jgi:hypothetical protein